ncbi:MAG: hypothetical protein E5X98_28940 [Mesorhizobium sp.]|nr:MAG: hypothetical protein E5X98_28940 [Mesorhizobium sp.]
MKRGKPLPEETVEYLDQLKAAGVSAADIEAFESQSVAPKAQIAPLGRSLFFIHDGVHSGVRNGDLFVPLGKDGAQPKEPVR